MMPQSFFVGRCFSCSKFQVLIVRKDNKFCCKICGIKQSVKKVYCNGDAKQCRIAAQHFNSIGNFENVNIPPTEHECKQFEGENSSLSIEPKTKDLDLKKFSKWNEYVDNDPNETHDEEYTQNIKYINKYVENQVENTETVPKQNNWMATRGQKILPTKKRPLVEDERSEKTYKKYEIEEDIDFSLNF